MSEHDTHTQTHPLDVDELWIAEWAAEGIAAAERYLAKHAAFATYLERTDGDHGPDR
jgi:hypothetical protein